jgi:hypothetical protein
MTEKNLGIEDEIRHVNPAEYTDLDDEAKELMERANRAYEREERKQREREALEEEGRRLEAERKKEEAAAAIRNQLDSNDDGTASIKA